MQALVPLRIIKLGGSLLSLSDLRPRFHAWLQTETPARNLVVVGGGRAVEAIRELDAIHHFPAKLTHWMCVDLMSITAALAKSIDSEFAETSSLSPDAIRALVLRDAMDSVFPDASQQLSDVRIVNLRKVA